MVDSAGDKRVRGRGRGRFAHALLVVASGFTLAGSACGGGSDRAQQAELDAFANGIALWVAGAQFWTVGAEPIIQVGAASGTEAETFLGVRHAVSLPDGALAVLDGLSAELRIFEPDGSVRVVVGGPGEGPGDFKNPTRLRSWADTIEVLDPGNFRRSRYLLDGELIQELSVSRSEDTPLDSWDEWTAGALRLAGPLLPSERGQIVPLLDGIPSGAAVRALVAADGWVWIELFASGVSGPVWTALGTEGSPAVTLEAPMGLRVLDIRGDRLVGLVRDADDVEYVHVYQIDRPSGFVTGPGLSALVAGG